MENLLTATIAFLGIFTFAFGAAWFLPLCAVTQEQHKAEKPHSDTTFVLFDLILILLDSIPIFWLISHLSSRKEGASKAQYKWKEEPAIRRCFYLWLVTLTLLVCSVFVLTHSLGS